MQVKLTKDQAFEKATTGRHRTSDSQYSEAVDLEDAIRLHTVGDHHLLEGYKTFMSWAENQLSKEKFREFEDVVRFPLPTVGVSGSIFDDLSKVFESENSTFSSMRFRTGSPVNGRTFNDRFNFKHTMKSRVFKTFASHPNSFFVIEKTPDDKEPRLYFVHLEHYMGHEYDEKNNLLWLAWTVDSKRDHLVVLDSEAFHHFRKKPSTTQRVDLTQSDYSYSKSKHNLGFVPADLIYKEFFEEDKKLKVNSPLARQVGQLDWLLFWKLAKKVNDKMSPFPIYSHYEFLCEYTDPVTKQSCDGQGNIFFYDETDTDQTGSLKHKKCPACAKSDSSKMIAGSRISIPAPETKEDVDLKNPVQVLNAEIESAEYVTKEEERLENAIYYSIVGKSLVALDTFSASETQIDIATESRKNVLLKMANVLLATHKKIVDSFATYMYPDDYLGNDISYGDNWFLRTDEQEVKLYSEYKNNGLPQQVKLAQVRQIIKNRYSTDTDERTKQLLMVDLEPFPLNTVQEVYDMFTKNMVPKKLVALKVYFNEIIDQIEVNIGHLGSFINLQDSRKQDKLVFVKKQIESVLELYIPYIGSIVQETQNQGTSSTDDED